MKQFDVPIIYRSPLITAIKQKRRTEDKMKKDFSPTLLDFGPLQVFLARHFGFCYGVENAIDIAFRTIEENPGKCIFLLSEMIHNPQVNEDLLNRGIQFMQDTDGRQLVPFDSLDKNDIVIIPAFGTTLDIEHTLREKGITTEKYNTTCPFVEKVWNRSEQIGLQKYTVIVHGKPTHEETRATFSHAAKNAPTLVISNMEEALLLGKYIMGEKKAEEFLVDFSGRYSKAFDPEQDLRRIGVVNQTTMLASDTQAIADYLKKIIVQRYGLNEKNTDERFADTRDTLCYATNENQGAVYGLLETKADLAMVVGGYNSSNTSHLVELCEMKLPTYFINNEENLHSQSEIEHYNFHKKKSLLSNGYLPSSSPLRVLVTSGASCPDAIVETVITRLVSFFPEATDMEKMIGLFQ